MPCPDCSGSERCRWPGLLRCYAAQTQRSSTRRRRASRPREDGSGGRSGAARGLQAEGARQKRFGHWRSRPATERSDPQKGSTFTLYLLGPRRFGQLATGWVATGWIAGVRAGRAGPALFREGRRSNRRGYVRHPPLGWTTHYGLPLWRRRPGVVSA